MGGLQEIFRAVSPFLTYLLPAIGLLTALAVTGLTRRARQRSLQSILKTLSNEFGFTCKLSGALERGYASGVLEGNRITVSCLSWPPPDILNFSKIAASAAEQQNRQKETVGALNIPSLQPSVYRLKRNIYLLISLHTERLLPPPLQIHKLKAQLPRLSKGHCTFAFDIDDMAALEQFMGGGVFPDPFLKQMKSLGAVSRSCVIHERGLELLLPHATATPKLLAQTVATTARIATVLASVNLGHDLYLSALRFRLGRQIDFMERETCLRELVSGYPDHPQAQETLRCVLASPDFHAAFMAANVMELDKYEFITGRLEGWDEKNRAQALGCLLEYRLPGGAEFLITYFTQTPSLHIKTAIIEAFFEFPEARANDVFLSGLRDPAPAVKEAAIEALAVRGGREALPELEELAADERQPPPLCLAARQAAKSIAERLGFMASGRLSLAGDESGAGGLSITSPASDGGLSAADTKERDDTSGN